MPYWKGCVGTNFFEGSVYFPCLALNPTCYRIVVWGEHLSSAVVKGSAGVHRYDEELSLDEATLLKERHGHNHERGVNVVLIVG